MDKIVGLHSKTGTPIGFVDEDYFNVMTSLVDKEKPFVNLSKFPTYESLNMVLRNSDHAKLISINMCIPTKPTEITINDGQFTAEFRWVPDEEKDRIQRKIVECGDVFIADEFPVIGVETITASFNDIKYIFNIPLMIAFDNGMCNIDWCHLVYFEGELAPDTYKVFELCDGNEETIMKNINGMGEMLDVVYTLVYDFILAYLHTQMIIIEDVKPEHHINITEDDLTNGNLEDILRGLFDGPDESNN